MAAFEKVGVLGAGAWGTALAQQASQAGRSVLLWGRDAALIEAMGQSRENRRYLPGIPLSEGIALEREITALAETDLILAVVPAQALRANLDVLSGLSWTPRPLVICAKGIEAGSGLLMTEVAAEVLPDWPLAVLSGPTFAAEVARGLPTAVTLAAEQEGLAEELAAALGTKTLRPYASRDVISAEVGGAVKNVIAIACGLVEGLGLGENARAALITRGLAEMARLAAAKGGGPQGLMGLAGIGDLSLTCNSPTSRNYRLGLALAKGGDAPGDLAEGAASAPAVVALAARLGVEMPIAEAVTAVLQEGADPMEMARGLLSRPFRRE